MAQGEFTKERSEDASHTVHDIFYALSRRNQRRLESRMKIVDEFFLAAHDAASSEKK